MIQQPIYATALSTNTAANIRHTSNKFAGATSNHSDQHWLHDEARHSRQLLNDFENQVLTTLVTTSKDAIHLLFRAADHQDLDSSDRHATPNDEFHDEVGGSVNMLSPVLASNETLALWSQHHFAKPRWFTPRKAVSYIE